MVQATRTVVYSRGQQLQQEIAERGQFFGWQALVLFLLSLALVLLFTRMIIGPVKGIEKMINRLGRGNRWITRRCLPVRANCVPSASVSSG
jgi:two-component system sensor histidine kinase GlrK